MFEPDAILTAGSKFMQDASSVNIASVVFEKNNAKYGGGVQLEGALSSSVVEVCVMEKPGKKICVDLRYCNAC